MPPAPVEGLPLMRPELSRIEFACTLLQGVSFDPYIVDRLLGAAFVSKLELNLRL